MIILMSPTKTMKEKPYKHEHKPKFAKEAKQIMEVLKTLSSEDIASFMKVNEKIANQNYERFQNYKVSRIGSDALYAYEGLQYKQLTFYNYTEEQLQYANKHVCILSGLYGVLKANDPITPYRLEMQSRIAINETKSLYDFWQSKVSKYLLKELKQHVNPYIVSLASNEYAKVLDEKVRKNMVSLTFKINKKGVLKVESTQAKMARGQMLQYLIHHTIDTLEGIKEFRIDEYEYREDLSSDTEFVFVKEI